jgi:uncharacterized protein (TIGR03382 family)
MIAAFAAATVSTAAPAAADCTSCQADLCWGAGPTATVARGTISELGSGNNKVLVSEVVVAGGTTTAAGQTIGIDDVAQDAAVGDEVIVVIGELTTVARTFNGQAVACGYDDTVQVELAAFVAANTSASTSCDAALDAHVNESPCDDTAGCQAAGGGGAWAALAMLGLVLTRGRRRPIAATRRPRSRT